MDALTITPYAPAHADRVVELSPDEVGRKHIEKRTTQETMNR